MTTVLLSGTSTSSFYATRPEEDAQTVQGWWCVPIIMNLGNRGRNSRNSRPGLVLGSSEDRMGSTVPHLPLPRRRQTDRQKENKQERISHGPQLPAKDSAADLTSHNSAGVRTPLRSSAPYLFPSSLGTAERTDRSRQTLRT